MSSPHFYQADKKFVQDVFGMRPLKELHQTTIDINPVGILTLVTIDLGCCQDYSMKFAVNTEFYNRYNAWLCWRMMGDTLHVAIFKKYFQKFQSWIKCLRECISVLLPKN